jgi:hypothetical protein
MLRAALLLACSLACVHAQAASCTATARQPVADARIRSAIDEAHRQHQLFGGQVIERNGGLFRVGYHEAEWDRPRGEPVPTWQRVATFWRALSNSEPPLLITSAGLVARAQAERAGAATKEEVAVHEALLRAAIVDTPWSAAFISYLMKTAGFSPSEFEFSDSHADYVQAAFETSAAEAAGEPTAYAFRACNAATTPPRAGDLLCATRATAADITRFDALATTMATRPRGRPFPMHCELVVRADEGGDAKLETIGGNVVQSVTLTRMTLNARKVLGDAYVMHTVPPVPPQHLSRRPWVVLLQFRN